MKARTYQFRKAPQPKLPEGGSFLAEAERMKEIKSEHYVKAAAARAAGDDIAACGHEERGDYAAAAEGRNLAYAWYYSKE